MGFIRRQTSEFSDPYVFRSIYYAFVRSKVEYASVVWCPYQITYIEQLERVQNRFARFAVSTLRWSDRSNLPPSDHLRQLIGIPRLEERRKLAQLLFIYDVITGKINSPCLLSQISFNVKSRTLRNHELFKLRYYSRNYTMHSSFSAMLRVCNEMSDCFDFNLNRYRFLNLVKFRLRLF